MLTAAEEFKHLISVLNDPGCKLQTGVIFFISPARWMR